MQEQSNKQNSTQKPKKPTDIPWLFVFIVFGILMLIFAILGMIYGDHFALIKGYDSFGNVCGTKNNKQFKNISLSGYDTSAKPYVLYLGSNLERPLTSVKICVEQCPDQTLVGSLEFLEYWFIRNVKYCRYDFDMNKLFYLRYYIEFASRYGPCPETSLELSFPVRFRCITGETMSIVRDFYRILNNMFSTFTIGLVNVYLTWNISVLLGGFAIGISLLMVVILLFQYKYGSWLVFGLATVAGGCFCGILKHAFDNHQTIETLDTIYFYALKDFSANESILYNMMVISLIITILTVFMCIFLAKRVKEANILYEETRNCLKENPTLLSVPLVALILLIGYLWLWTYVLICVATAAKPTVLPFQGVPKKKKLTTYDEQYYLYNHVEYLQVKSIRRLLWPCLFGFTWTIQFLFACQEFCLDVTVAFWYYKRKEEANLRNVVKLLFCYHLGSVVKGTVITGIAKVPQIFLSTLNALLTPFVNNFTQRLILYERNISKWNHTAYAFVAMESIGFSSSVQSEILAEAPRIEIFNRNAKMVMLLAKLFVTILTCIGGMLLLMDQTDVLLYTSPILFNAIIAFLYAHVLFALPEKVMDMIIVCARKDKQNNITGKSEQNKLADLLRNAHTSKTTFIVVSPSKDSSFAN